MLKGLQKGYEFLISLGSFLKSPLLLLCRLYWGWLFCMAGWGKLQSIDQFIGLLDKYNYPAPAFWAYVGAWTELVGGLCLVIGFASRLVSIPLIIMMFTAYATVHQEALLSLFSSPDAFVSESPFNFLLTSLFVLAFGPGRFSVDYLLEKTLFHKEKGLLTAK
jgi:putative oxidoreductase